MREENRATRCIAYSDLSSLFPSLPVFFASPSASSHIIIVQMARITELQKSHIALYISSNHPYLFTLFP